MPGREGSDGSGSTASVSGLATSRSCGSRTLGRFIGTNLPRPADQPDSAQLAALRAAGSPHRQATIDAGGARVDEVSQKRTS